MLPNSKILSKLGDSMDKVITLPFHQRKTIDGEDLILNIYDAFRNTAQESLIYSALKGIVNIKDDNPIIFLATGASGKHFMPEIGETDGPLGTAVLSRTLARGLRALPVIFTDEEQVTAIVSIMKSLGLTVTDIEKGRQDQIHAAYPNSVIVKPFPKDHNEAEKEAHRLVDSFNPSAAIAIERSGFNSKKHYHTSGGVQVDWKAKMDYIFYKCNDNKILTVGIGDGGNEIGMGAQAEYISSIHKYGTKCKCPCQSGVISKTETTCTVVSTTANWGAYALSDILAVHLNRKDLLYDANMEYILLQEAIKNGCVDAKTGFGIPSVDGVKLKYSASVINMLFCLAEQCMS